VVSLVQSLATELDDTNITANILMPAVIDTRATRATLPYADYMDWPKPSEIAAVLDFLLSPASEVIKSTVPLSPSTAKPDPSYPRLAKLSPALRMLETFDNESVATDRRHSHLGTGSD